MAAKGRLNPFGDSSKDFVFFPSLGHKKGVHRIVRGLESNCGLILLTGEIGIGKTSLARHIQHFLRDRFVFVELGNPYQTPTEQMYQCCEKFGLETRGLSSIHDCVKTLETYFRKVLKGGTRAAIVFDESHLLTKRHLSLIHILSNLRAEDGPLVQILLVGQLEIFDLLGTSGMEALNQRIGVRCELSPLTVQDTARYIQFKLEKSGMKKGVQFSDKAVQCIWKESRGIPRLINHVCAHALDALAFKDSNTVTPSMVSDVCSDPVYTGMFNTKPKEPGTRKPWWILALLLALALIGGGAWYALTQSSGPAPGESPQASQPQESPAPAPQADTPPVPAPLADSTPQRPTVDPALDEEPEVVIVIEEPEPRPAPTPRPKAQTTDGIKDGNSHPVIRELVIGAIAWNEDPAKRIAVIDTKLVHEGEMVDDIRILTISQEFILFKYEGDTYKLTFAR